MSLSKSKVCLLVLTMLAGACASAQKLPDPLVQAVRQAVTTNPEVQARWNGFMAAESERDVARAGLGPQVDITAAVGVERRVTPAANYGTFGFNGQRINLTQMLFDGGMTSSEVKRLGFAKLARYYDLIDASESAALEAVRAYADVARYRELVQAASDNYVEHKQSALLVQERSKSGVSKGADVEQAAGRLALAESNLLTELANLHDVSARYQRVVGELPPANLRPLPDPFKLGDVPNSVNALMREGLRNSPALNAAVENVRASKQAIESRKANDMPRLDLRAYGSLDSNSGGQTGASRLVGVQAALNYNVYRGGSDKALERQTVLQKVQSRDVQDGVCREVRQNLSTAYSSVLNLKEQQASLDQHRLSAEKAREAYRQQFQIGQRTLLDLLDTQNEYFEASRSYISTRYNQIIAQARTLSGMGKLASTVGVRREEMPSAKDLGQDRDTIDDEDLCPLAETTVESLEKIKEELVTTPMPKAVARSNVPCDRITLLPEEDGKVGIMQITDAKGGQVRLDKAYASSVNDCEKSQFYQSSADEVKSRYPGLLPALPAKAKYYRVNFVIGKTTLLPESQETLKAMMVDYSSRPAPEVVIIGHSDKVGNTKLNEDLSRRRALEIKKILTSGGGVPFEDIGIAWRGDRDPLPGTEGKRVEPRNRRVEVKVQ